MAKLKIIILLITYSIICNSIYQTNDYNIVSIPENKVITEELTLEEIPKKEIIIEKINLNKPLYPINDKKNNIEENITILPGSISPEKENSIIFLAAHSGPAPNSYFNDLDKLKEHDKIILNINNKTYTYKVTSIWETIKDGTIEVSKQSTNQLILTTCSKKDKNKQLIINTKKES